MGGLEPLLTDAVQCANGGFREQKRIAGLHSFEKRSLVMSSSKSPVQTAFDNVVKTAVHANLKSGGFGKTGLNWHRRLGNAIHVVNIQMSAVCSWEVKRFYINVGVALDEICRHMNKPVLEKPKESECVSRGLRQRSSVLLSGSSEFWQLKERGELDSLGDELREVISALLVEIDKIRTVSHLVTHPWNEHNTDTKAQAYYLTGDYKAAWATVEAKAEFFSREESLNPRRARLGKTDAWLENWNLTELPERLG